MIAADSQRVPAEPALGEVVRSVETEPRCHAEAARQTTSSSTPRPLSGSSAGMGTPSGGDGARVSFYLEAMRATGGEDGFARRVTGWCARHPGEQLFSREGYLSFMREAQDLAPTTVARYAQRLRAAWLHVSERGFGEAPPSDLPTYVVSKREKAPREADVPIVMVQHYVIRLRRIFGARGLASVLGVTEQSIDKVLSGLGTLPSEVLAGLERVFVVAMADDLDVSPTEIERLRRVVRGRRARDLAELAQARTGE